ncbi:MAG: flavin reductase [Clostridia bacterium]|nr:flavin reductase [Clostridia bacterium]
MQKEISIKDLQLNPFKLIGEEWMLIAAGDEQKHNMMTASWGGLGVLWEKNVATVYIRPTRYTVGFVEKQEYFSLNFFGKNKAPHKIGGSRSGRDIDKANAANLTPVFDSGAVYYQEAELVLVCRKLYHSAFDNKNFVDAQTENFYDNDYHKIFIGEIVKVLKQ